MVKSPSCVAPSNDTFLSRLKKLIFGMLPAAQALFSKGPRSIVSVVVASKCRKTSGLPVLATADIKSFSIVLPGVNILAISISHFGSATEFLKDCALIFFAVLENAPIRCCAVASNLTVNVLTA